MQYPSQIITTRPVPDDTPGATFLSACPDDFSLVIPPHADEFPIPDDDTCTALWDDYAMPQNIRNHSMRVGEIATFIARLGAQNGIIEPGYVAAVRASALLHDLAKVYCLENGGNHAQLGGAWVLRETGNPALAQGVLHHVWWPFTINPLQLFLPLVVLYSDKRVRHDDVVSLGARYSDLLERYGKTEYIKERILMSMRQVQAIELTLSEILKVELHASTFDCGRLVD